MDTVITSREHDIMQPLTDGPLEPEVPLPSVPTGTPAGPSVEKPGDTARRVEEAWPYP